MPEGCPDKRCSDKACPDKTTLARALDGALGADGLAAGEHAEVRAHLRGCRRCARRAAQHWALDHALAFGLVEDGAGDERVSAELARRLRAIGSQGEAPSRKTRSSGRSRRPDCPSRRGLARALDGEGPEEVLTHISRCARCARRAARLESVDQEIADAVSAEDRPAYVPDGLRSRLSKLGRRSRRNPAVKSRSSGRTRSSGRSSGRTSGRTSGRAHGTSSRRGRAEAPRSPSGRLRGATSGRVRRDHPRRAPVRGAVGALLVAGVLFALAMGWRFLPIGSTDGVSGPDQGGAELARRTAATPAITRSTTPDLSAGRGASQEPSAASRDQTAEEGSRDQTAEEGSRDQTAEEARLTPRSSTVPGSATAPGGGAPAPEDSSAPVLAGPPADDPADPVAPRERLARADTPPAAPAGRPTGQTGRPNPAGDPLVRLPGIDGPARAAPGTGTSTRLRPPALVAGLRSVRAAFVRGRLVRGGQGASAGEPVRSGAEVAPQDALIVGDGGAQVALGDGVRVAAAKGARLRLGRLRSGRPWVSLEGGTILASVAPGNPNGGVALELGDARLVTDGGEFAAERRKNEPVRVEVRAGEGVLTTKSSSLAGEAATDEAAERVALASGDRGTIDTTGTWSRGGGRISSVPRLRAGRVLVRLDFERGAGFFPGYPVAERADGAGQALGAKPVRGDESFGLRIRSRWLVPTRPGVVVRFRYRADQDAPLVVRGTSRRGQGRFYTVVRHPARGAWAVCEVFPSTFRHTSDPDRRPAADDRLGVFEILGGRPGEPGTLEIDDFEVVDLDR